MIRETEATIVRLEQAVSVVQLLIDRSRVNIAQSRRHIADANMAVRAAAPALVSRNGQ